MKNKRANPAPKKPHFTPAQEEERGRIERQLIRSQIMQYGVMKYLEHGEYCDSLDVCAQVLKEANDIRKAAYQQRAHLDTISPIRMRRQ